jgi:hypothetical protein
MSSFSIETYQNKKSAIGNVQRFQESFEPVMDNKKYFHYNGSSIPDIPTHNHSKSFLKHDKITEATHTPLDK